MHHDVIVVGAGPGGASVADLLRAAGHAVLLLERSRFDEPRVGETLSPGIPPRQADAIACRVVRSVWATDVPVERAHGGWHVDRVRFDAAGGVGARTGNAVLTCAFDGKWWEVGCAGGERFGARVVVDATGRRATIGRLLGARRMALDRLTAVTATVGAADPGGGLLVEATPDGWWYTAPVPGNRLVATFCSDADLIRGVSWEDALGRAPWTAERLGEARGDPRVVGAAGHRVLRQGDPRPWVAVGDAALAVDPLAGSGVRRALTGAVRAAEVAGALVRGRDEIDGYESWLDGECTAMLLARRDHYASVRRFATPFWTRREAVRTR